ncbi:g11872 [Coccomyxa elongata]
MSTEMRERVLMHERMATAVLLTFRAAGRARAGSGAADEAHAAMEMMPADLIKQIICTAKLLIAGLK